MACHARSRSRCFQCKRMVTKPKGNPCVTYLSRGSLAAAKFEVPNFAFRGGHYCFLSMLLRVLHIYKTLIAAFPSIWLAPYSLSTKMTRRLGARVYEIII